MAYTVFESTNMGSTHYAERIFDAVATTDIENGTFGYLDGTTDDESHVYNFVAGTKDGEKVVVADQPAWDTDTCKASNQRRDKFIIPAGTIFRVRIVKINDEFGITIDGVTVATQDVVADGVYFTIDADTGKLVASESSTEGAAFEATVMRHRVAGSSLVTPIREYGYSSVIYEAKITTLA